MLSLYFLHHLYRLSNTLTLFNIIVVNEPSSVYPGPQLFYLVHKKHVVVSQSDPFNFIARQIS